MNYPVWYLPEIGGGTLIALIAILHVFVSHFAVGGGLYLIYSEKKGIKEGSQTILDFTRMHARFFLLITMVFGSITGVGIWFIIALVNPGATSFLIHNFVFGWAAEWVFFVVEIVAAFVYFYNFGKMDNATHLKVGWIYFIAAWMSLFLINGIICVMLTPGGWADGLDFWVGFFNPSFWPSLFFRTFISLMIAASYGFLSASFSRIPEVRLSMTRFSAKWALISFVAAIPFGIWYVMVLPEQAQLLVLGKSPTITWILPYGLVGLVLFFVIALVAGILRPALNLKPIALLSMVAALLVIGGFEWVREAARRPYVINEIMYSNGILKSQADLLNSSGFMKNAIWTENLAIDESNLMDVGKELFITQCYACHTLGGGNNDIVPQTASMSFRAVKSYLGKIHETRYFMPPFFGTEQEKVALAAFIAGDLHKKPVEFEPEAVAAIHPGQLLFEEQCAACHGVEEVTPAFSGQAQDASIKLLRTLNTISEEMEPFNGSDAEAVQLAEYLADPAKAVASPPPAAATGEQLFEENCASCHDAKSVQESLAGTATAEVVKTLETLNEISDEMQPYEGSTAEKELLATFLNGFPEPAVEKADPVSTAAPEQLNAVVNPEKGGEVFVAQCGVCHSPQQTGAKLVNKGRAEIFDILGKLDKLQKTMPPFAGTPEEKEMLADFLFHIAKGGK